MWATRYAGWPAQRKLEYMDRLMRELASVRPRVTSKRQVDPLPRLKKTLGEHYRKKREHYGLDHPDFYESDLRNLFSDAPEYAKHLSAARFVRRIRKEVRGTVASFTDSYQYTIDQLLEKIIERCRELNLRLTDTEDATKIDFMVFLTVQTMNYLHSGRHRVALMSAKLRVLALVHRHLIPPDTIEEGTDIVSAPWRTEYDVISTLTGARPRGARRSASTTTSARSAGWPPNGSRTSPSTCSKDSTTSRSSTRTSCRTSSC